MATTTKSSLVPPTLVGAAAIQGLVGFLGWFIHSPQFSALDWVITFGGGIFLALAFVGKSKPHAASLAAMLLYSAFLIMQLSISTELLMTGWIFKLPIILLLIVGVWSAFHCSSLGEGHVDL